MSFKNYNRGKRAVAIDLTSDDGRAILYRLVEDADVFLTSYLPGDPKKLKVDVEDIRAPQPAHHLRKGTGYGPRGPGGGTPRLRRRGLVGPGFLGRLRDAGLGRRVANGMVGHGDTISGTVLAGGICAALLQRERTGVAPVVDGSLLGTAIWYNHQPIVAAKLGRHLGRSAGTPQRAVPTSNAYRTKDGRFLSLVFVNDPDVDWVDLCEHLGRPDLAADPRFVNDRRRAGQPGRRGQDARRDLRGHGPSRSGRRSLVTARGVWAAVQTAGEIHDDPQTLANGFVRDGRSTRRDRWRYPVPPVLFDEEAGDIERAPDYCEHTDEVLAEAGFTVEEIGSFRSARVIA